MKTKHTTFNKRGSSELWTAEKLLSLILVFSLVVVMMIILARQLGLIAGGSETETQAALSSYTGLTGTVHAMLDDWRGYQQAAQILFLPEDYALVGFDRDWDRKMTKGQPHAQEEDTAGPIIKPLRCGNKACICLYGDDIQENEISKREENVIDCETFEGNVQFFGLFDTQKEPRVCGTERKLPVKTGDASIDDSKYSYLVLYGNHCGEWGSQSIYLEKIHPSHSDPISIFMSIFDAVPESRRNAMKALTPLHQLKPYTIKTTDKQLVASVSQQWGSQISAAFARANVPPVSVVQPNLIAAVIAQESAGDPHAVSYGGTAGLVQFTSATAKEYSVENGYPGTFSKNRIVPCACADGSLAANKCLNARCNPSNDDRFDPDKSLTAGVAYLNKIAMVYLSSYASSPDFKSFVLMAYNGGPTLMAKALKATGKTQPSFNDVIVVLNTDIGPGDAKVAEMTQYAQRIVAYESAASSDSVV